MAVADNGGRSCPDQHHWQCSSQDAGVDGGKNLFLSEEGAILPGWNQGDPAVLGIHASMTCSAAKADLDWCLSGAVLLRC